VKGCLYDRWWQHTRDPASDGHGRGPVDRGRVGQRLDHWRPARGGFRASGRRIHGNPFCDRDQFLHHGAARGPTCSRHRAGGRGGSAVLVLYRDCQCCTARRRQACVRRHRIGYVQRQRRDDRCRTHPAHPRHHAGASDRLARGPGSHRLVGRATWLDRLGRCCMCIGYRLQRQAHRWPHPVCLFQFPSAQGDHHRSKAG